MVKFTATLKPIDRVSTIACVAFMVAVLIQLLQVNNLSPQLRVALFACAVGIPFSTCGAFILHDRPDGWSATGVSFVALLVGSLCTLVSVTAILMHFSTYAGLTFLAACVCAFFLHEANNVADHSAQLRNIDDSEGAP